MVFVRIKEDRGLANLLANLRTLSGTSSPTGVMASPQRRPPERSPASQQHRQLKRRRAHSAAQASF
jgi:hypothetical protein